MNRSVKLLAALLAVALPLAAGAGVYLNGVRIDGVRNQTFEKATVTIDAQGHVRIDAPGYQVSGSSAAAPPVPSASTGTMTRRYFLVTSQTEVGATQYDVDVYVNATWIRRLRSDESQIVSEITKHLRPGENRILLNARKTMEGGRRSASPAHTFRVIIGEGAAGGNKIMIERPLVEFERTAAEIEDVSREYTLTAR